MLKYSRKYFLGFLRQNPLTRFKVFFIRQAVRSCVMYLHPHASSARVRASRPTKYPLVTLIRSVWIRLLHLMLKSLVLPVALYPYRYVTFYTCQRNFTTSVARPCGTIPFKYFSRVVAVYVWVRGTRDTLSHSTQLGACALFIIYWTNKIQHIINFIFSR